MKGIKKVLIVLAALAAVFGFVACSDNDDDDGGSGGGGSSSSGNVVAVYVWENNGKKETITFFSDGTYSDVYPDGGTKEGTYEGDPTENGDIILTRKGASSTTTVTVENGELYYPGVGTFTRKQ